MQRLTEKADEYFHKGGIKYYPKDKGLNKAICNKLGEYEDLEEQGLLLRLPCKVGDKVWHIIHGEVIEDNITNVYIKYQGVFPFKDCLIGKLVFVTKEEAEAKLREMEAGE